jgi:predicted Zn-dependent protease
MLDRDLVAEVLAAARRKGGDFAEVFVEERTSTSVRLDDTHVEELTTGLDRGAGVRVVRGTTYGYAYSNRLDRDSLLEAAAAASDPRLRSTPRPKWGGSARWTRLRAASVPRWPRSPVSTSIRCNVA